MIHCRHIGRRHVPGNSIATAPEIRLDGRTRRYFRISNLALFIPLLSSAFGSTELGKQVSDLLRSMTG